MCTINTPEKAPPAETRAASKPIENYWVDTLS
jgi:hypothetical protein